MRASIRGTVFIGYVIAQGSMMLSVRRPGTSLVGPPSSLGVLTSQTLVVPSPFHPLRCRREACGWPRVCGRGGGGASYQAAQAPSTSLAAGCSWRAAGIEPAGTLMPQVSLRSSGASETFWTCCSPPATRRGAGGLQCVSSGQPGSARSGDVPLRITDGRRPPDTEKNGSSYS